MQEEELEASIGDTKLLDVKAQKPQSIDIVLYQDAQDYLRDELQQGGGNTLGVIVAIAIRGEADGDGTDDDDDPNKRKEFDPMDKPHEEEATIE